MSKLQNSFLSFLFFSFFLFVEELDTLIGDKSEKLRSSIMSCSPPGIANAALPRQMAVQPRSLGEPTLSPGGPQPLHSIHAPGALHIKNPLPNLLGGQQTACYTSPQGFPQISSTLMQQPPDPQTLFPSGDTQSELRTQPSITQDSPLPAQTPPMCGVKMLTEHSTARTMQDTLMQEGDLSNDIDALNPSLTDFDLQGGYLRHFYFAESGLLHHIPTCTNIFPPSTIVKASLYQCKQALAEQRHNFCPFYTTRPGHCYRDPLTGLQCFTHHGILHCTFKRFSQESYRLTSRTQQLHLLLSKSAGVKSCKVLFTMSFSTENYSSTTI